MALFKSKEERQIEEMKRQREEQEKLKKEEEKILKSKIFYGKVGQIHQGLSIWGLWGVMDNGKIKFNPSTFEIHDDRLLIQRNKNFIKLSQIKEIFYEVSKFSQYPYEAIIVLNNNDGIPISGRNEIKDDARRELQAFINILNKLIKDNKSNNNAIESNVNNISSEDKFDKLIDLGKMHDKGLLTDKEFFSLKQELLSGTNEDTTSTENDENVCKNCGAEVSPNDAFCSECGSKIN